MTCDEGMWVKTWLRENLSLLVITSVLAVGQGNWVLTN